MAIFRDRKFKKYFEESLTVDEKKLIIESLKDASTAADLDPVIVFDFIGPSIDALLVHLGTLGLGVLPAFLGGVMPANRADLEASIIHHIRGGRGILTGRIVSGLTAGDAYLIGTNIGVFYTATLRPLVAAAAGVPNLLEVRHLVSQNRQPPNDIRMTTSLH